MSDFLLHLAWLSVSMSVVILLVWLFTGILGKKISPKSRYIAWAAVMVSLCIGVGLFRLPAVFTIKLPAASVTRQEVVEKEEIKLPAYSDLPGTNDSTASTTTPPSVSDQTSSNVTVIIPPSTALNLSVQKTDSSVILFALWAVGALLYFNIGIISYLRCVRRYQRGKKLCSKETQALYQALCAKEGLRRMPRLYICSHLGSPVLYGFYRSTILLPDLTLSEDALIGILRHELTHYRRKDIWLKLCCLLAQSLYWFHPLVHFAAARCHAEMELSCDQAVLMGLDEQARRDYGSTMLDILKHCRKHAGLLTTQFNPHKKAVKERVVNILDTGRKKRGILLLTAVLALCLTAGIIIGCSMAQKSKQAVFTLPAAVTKVDAAAFAEVEVESIRELVLSSQVSEIDFSYLNTFPNLRKVTIENENPSYESYENLIGGYVLMDLTDHELLYLPPEENHEISLYGETTLTECYPQNESILMYTCGAVLDLYYTKDETDAYWFLKSIAYDGVRHVLDKDRQLIGNCSFDVFRITDGFVASHSYYGWSHAFIFQNGGLIEYNPPSADSGGYGINTGGDGVCFYPGENGELLYTKTTASMVSIQTIDWFLELTSADQFWKEEGVVSIADGNLVYTPTASYTVSDYFKGQNTTIEQAFEQLKENRQTQGFESLSEMFAANRSGNNGTSDAYQAVSRYLNLLVRYLHEPLHYSDIPYPDTILGLIFEFCYYNQDQIMGVEVDESNFSLRIDSGAFDEVMIGLFGERIPADDRALSLIGARYDAQADQYVTSYAKDYWGGDHYSVEFGSDLFIREDVSGMIVTAYVGVWDEVNGIYVAPTRLEYHFREVGMNGMTYYQIEQIRQPDDDRPLIPDDAAAGTEYLYDFTFTERYDLRKNGSYSLSFPIGLGIENNMLFLMAEFEGIDAASEQSTYRSDGLLPHQYKDYRFDYEDDGTLYLKADFYQPDAREYIRYLWTDIDSVKTITGVGVGSTEKELLAAHPENLYYLDQSDFEPIYFSLEHAPEYDFDSAYTLQTFAAGNNETRDITFYLQDGKVAAIEMVNPYELRYVYGYDREAGLQKANANRNDESF